VKKLKYVEFNIENNDSIVTVNQKMNEILEKIQEIGFVISVQQNAFILNENDMAHEIVSFTILYKVKPNELR
jgi:hypothetical protein